jgi:hypothetical protein
MKKISPLLVVLGLILGACCDEDFIIPGGDYDFQIGAIDVTGLLEDSECSFDAEYTTEGATPDGENPSCEDPDNNRWFKFTATVEGAVFISVHVGGSYGTQTETRITLWDTDGTTDLDCATYISSPSESVYVNYSPLTPGETYFISVDSTSDTFGTFTLCLSDVD